MPLPLFQSHTPEEPSASSPSRLSAVQSQVRDLLSRASMHSNQDSPAISSSDRTTPKLPRFSLFRRSAVSPAANASQDELLQEPHMTGGTPVQSQQIPESYQRAISLHFSEIEENLSAIGYHHSPRPEPLLPPLPEHDHVLVRGFEDPHGVYADIEAGTLDPEEAQVAAIVQRRTRRRHRKAWKKRRTGNVAPSTDGSRLSPIRKKGVLCVVSGLFLITVLSIYLSLALTRPSLTKPVHILFVLVIILTTILFCHSLVRLCMLALRSPLYASRRHRHHHGYHIRHHNRHHHHTHGQHIHQEMTGPASHESFTPTIPIRVHLARDEELDEPQNATDTANDIDDEKVEGVKQPPPAYGIWRCSVPINPDLLHWQRASSVHSSPVPLPTPFANPTSHAPRSPPSPDSLYHDAPVIQPLSSDRIQGEAPNADVSPSLHALQASDSSAALYSGPGTASQGIRREQQGPRPPSYVSEDGVAYVVDAGPRVVGQSAAVRAVGLGVDGGQGVVDVGVGVEDGMGRAGDDVHPAFR